MENNDDFSDIAPINFRNEKEYNSTIEEILELTRDNKADWKKREAATLKMGGIMQGNMGQSTSFIKLFNQKLYINLAVQMVDLRSSLMKEACRVAVLAAQVYQENIEVAIDKLMSPLILFKLVGTANKVISDTGSKCVMDIIANLESVKVMNRIFEIMKNKGNLIRLRVAQEYLFMISNYSISTLDKCMNIIEELIICLISDASSDVRACARKIYFKYIEIYPNRTERLFDALEKSAQKALLNDANNDDTSLSTSDNLSSTNKSKSSTTSSNNIRNVSKEKFSRSLKEKTEKIETASDYQTGFSKSLKVEKLNEPIKSATKKIISPQQSPQKNLSQNEKNYSSSSVKKPVIMKKENQSINIKSSLSTNYNNEEETNEISEFSGSSSSINSSIKKPKFKNIEDMLKVYINRAMEQDTSTKTLAFEQISLMFNEIYSTIDYITTSSLNNLVNCHITNLLGFNQNIQIQIMKNLTKFVFYLSEIFSDEHLIKLGKIVINKMTSEDEALSASASSLYDIMRKKVDHHILMKPLVEFIDQGDSEEVLTITFDILNTLVDVAVTVLSDQNYLNSLILKIGKLTVTRLDGDTHVIYKVMDCLELIWRKYPRQFVQSFVSIDESYKKCLVSYLERHKKVLADYLKKELASLADRAAKENKKMINKAHVYNTDDLFDESNVDYSVLNFAASQEFSSFLNYLYQAPGKNLNNFLLSLNKIKSEQVYPVINHIEHIIYKDPGVLINSMNLLINRVLFIFTRFTEFSDEIKDLILTISSNLDKELYLQIVPKYLSLQQVPNIIYTVLESIKNVVTELESENILLLLPSFIETIFEMLNHHVSDIRKMAVFCIVEIAIIVGSDFDEYLNGLNISQKNLINIYIKKRKEQG